VVRRLSVHLFRARRVPSWKRGNKSLSIPGGLNPSQFKKREKGGKRLLQSLPRIRNALRPGFPLGRIFFIAGGGWDLVPSADGGKIYEGGSETVL